MSNTSARADLRLRTALHQYAERARAELGFEKTAIVSYAGIWLLLASLAEVAVGETRQRLADLLGMPVDQAGSLAAALTSEPHPTLAAALGAWAAPGIEVPVETSVLPDKATLDAWAREHTRGLIETFPAAISPLTAFVAASAFVLEPRWRTPMQRFDEQRLSLTDGLIAVVDTSAAGPVAVAKPHSTDGVDVISVQAGPDVDPAAVWEAVAEICDRLGAGERLDREVPTNDGHSWTIATETQWLNTWESGDRWRALMREWGASAKLNLLAAPGVGEVVASLRAVEPQLDGEVQCVQAAVADYGADGFRAAAVTVMEMAPTGMPPEPRDIRVVTLDFDRPHAVTAVARGGAWEGVRLFDAWVRPTAAF